MTPNIRKASASKNVGTASEQITEQFAELGDWRGALCERLRKLINAAEPTLTEEVKWGTAMWTSSGLVCALGAFKDHVKINFFKGATLADPKKLFNAGLDAKGTRAIDFTKDAKVDEAALKALIRAAAAYNQSVGAKKK
jgi:hypothetical protein